MSYYHKVIKRKKYDNVSRSILEQIADSLIEDGKNTFSYGLRYSLLLGLIIKEIAKHNRQKFNQIQINQAINGLEKRNILKLETIDNNVYVSLEEKGKKKIAKYSLTKILEYKRKKKKWNGKWYMVFFDVPETQRNKRECLRTFLKDIGFYQFQKSVYIFPFECENEIKYIRSVVEAEKYTKYIIADKIEDEEKIKKHFKL